MWPTLLNSSCRVRLSSGLPLIAVALFAACGEDPTAANSSASPAPVLASTGLGSWTIKAPIPSPRWDMTGAVAQNASGQYLLYTIGGSNENNRALKRVEAYNAATDKWIRKANLPVDRTLAAAATLGGKLYVIGGINLNGNRTKSLYRYDPLADTWVQKASLPVASAGGITGVMGGKLYILIAPVDFFSAQQLYRYNPTSDVWQRLADVPHNHRGGIGGVIDGKFYVAWGVSDAVDVFDPSTKRWTTPAPESECTEDQIDCSQHSAASAVFRNELYAIHGTNDDEFDEVRAYDPLTNVWTRKNNMNHPRVRGVAGTVRNAAGQTRIVVAGGSDLNGDRVPSTEMYAP